MIIKFGIRPIISSTGKKQKPKTKKDYKSSAYDCYYSADFSKKLLIERLADLNRDIELYNKIQQLNTEIENLKLRIEKETDDSKKQALISVLNEKIKKLNELKKSFE